MKISRFTTDEISMLKEKCNFSETELRCFELKAKDYTNTQITFELGMSSSSVAIAMRRIREKITFVMERHIQEMHSSAQPEGCNGSGCPVYHTMQEWSRIPDSLSIRGRMYIYGDYRTDEDVSIPRIKIGDGITPISALPFATMSITNSDMERWDGRSEFDGNNLGDVMWIDSSATIDKPFTFHTDELRVKYSQTNVMKSNVQRQRMSRNNPMKDTKIAMKVNAKRKQAVIIGNVEYESVKAVSEIYNVATSTVKSWCIRGYDNKHISCYYKGHPTEKYQSVNNGQQKSVFYMGKHYNSSSELGRALGIAQTTASRWCRQGYDTYGNVCRYDDDLRKTSFVVKNKAIPVIVNGVWYPNKQSACRALNISHYTLTTYLNGTRKDTQYICNYDNQQPS